MRLWKNYEKLRRMDSWKFGYRLASVGYNQSGILQSAGSSEIWRPLHFLIFTVPRYASTVHAGPVFVSVRLSGRRKLLFYHNGQTYNQIINNLHDSALSQRRRFPPISVYISETVEDGDIVIIIILRVLQSL